MSDRLAPIKCAACGRSVTRRSRQQKYCSDRCRVFAAREKTAAGALKVAEGHRPSGSVTNPPKLLNQINGLQGTKSDFSDVPLANWRVVAGPPGTIGTNPWQSIINARARTRARLAGVYSRTPLNLLGGYRWPGAPKLDAKTVEKICHCEIGGVRR